MSYHIIHVDKMTRKSNRINPRAPGTPGATRQSVYQPGAHDNIIFPVQGGSAPGVTPGSGSANAVAACSLLGSGA